MRKIVVDSKYDGKKLNKFILDNFSTLSSNVLFRALRQKDIKVNGMRIKDNVEVYNGDIVEVFISDELLFGTEIFNLEVVFEDENILAINKPINISVTDESNRRNYRNYSNYNTINNKKNKGNNITITNNQITLTKIVKKKFGNNLEPCHRLDRNTKRNCIIC